MKKIILLTGMWLSVLMAFSSYGDGNVALKFTVDGDGGFYNLNAVNWSDNSLVLTIPGFNDYEAAFNNYDFGDITELILNGGAAITWADGEDFFNESSWEIEYRVYPTGGSLSEWANFFLDQEVLTGGNNNDNYLAQNLNKNINVSENLSPGDYTIGIRVYRTHHWSNGSQRNEAYNQTATFTLNPSIFKVNFLLDATILTNSNMNVGSTDTQYSFGNASINASNYVWKINDVTIDNLVDDDLTYTFTSPGIYTVKLTGKDISSNEDFIEKTIRIVKKSDVGNKLMGGDMNSSSEKYWVKEDLGKNNPDMTWGGSDVFFSGAGNISAMQFSQTTNECRFVTYQPVYLNKDVKYNFDMFIKGGRTSGNYLMQFYILEPGGLPTTDNKDPWDNKDPQKNALGWIEDSSSLDNLYSATSGIKVGDNKAIANDLCTFTPDADGIYFVAVRFASWNNAQFNFSIGDLVLEKAPSELTWTGTKNTYWNNSSNWGGSRPKENTIVTISKGASNYPILTEAVTIDKITFKPDAELGNQHLLTATNGATVKMNLATARWHMLSMPMEAAIEDFHFLHTPKTWFKTFKVEDGNVGWDYRTTLSETYQPGTGFAYWVEKLSTADVHKNQEVVLNGSIVKTTQTIGLNFGLDGTYTFALAGNPFMTSIDFDALQGDSDTGYDNRNVISPNYMVWTSAGFVGYCGTTGYFGTLDESEDLTNNERKIPPLQAIIVEQATTPTSTDLVFNLDKLGSQATGKGPGLRATKNNTANKLDVVARNENGAVLTFIAKRENGQSALKLKDVSLLPDIYTLNGTTAFGAQIINTDDVTVPLGISTTYSGEITLTFSGMDSYDADIKLIDKVNNDLEIDLIDESQTYTFSHTPNTNGEPVEDRFLIAFAPRTITGIATGQEDYISIFAKDRDIQAISTISDLIRQIVVYDIHGQLVYENKQVNLPAYTIKDIQIPASKNVYIVKLITEKTTKNVKLIID